MAVLILQQHDGLKQSILWMGVNNPNRTLLATTIVAGPRLEDCWLQQICRIIIVDRFDSAPSSAQMESRRGKVALGGLGMFVLLFAGYLCLFVASSMLFPGPHTVPLVCRISVAALATIALFAGSERLVKRNLGGSASLGMLPLGRAASAVVIGSVAACVWVGLIAAVFRIFVPFHFERGELGWEEAVREIAGFLLSNVGEELVFRGFLLLFLMRIVGLRWALVIIAGLFSLFHLPGLSGIAALKMACTTAAASYFFAAMFLLTRSLWGAIAAHFMGNVVLHKVVGLSGGTAALKPVLHGTYPSSDPGFWGMFLVTFVLAGFAFQFIAINDRKTKQPNQLSRELVSSDQV